MTSASNRQVYGSGHAIQCRLTNPELPGDIHAVGSFGPWNIEGPGDTPLSGDYTFCCCLLRSDLSTLSFEF